VAPASGTLGGLDSLLRSLSPCNGDATGRLVVPPAASRSRNDNDNPIARSDRPSETTTDDDDDDGPERGDGRWWDVRRTLDDARDPGHCQTECAKSVAKMRMSCVAGLGNCETTLGIYGQQVRADVWEVPFGRGFGF